MATRPWVCIAALLAASISHAAGQTKPTPRAATMRVPAGFVVEPAALPPLVQRPMMAGFDERGRLFVAESAGMNLPFDKLRDKPPNFIRMLEDTDGDGVFDRSTIFADRLNFPTGALWLDGALYVCDPPGVWKLEDINGDGVCDQRTPIVTGFSSTGNGADLHGPYRGPDGYLYFADGRNGHDMTLGDGRKWTGEAAAVYRCRTDGSGLEVVFGGGMDNPVEAVFTPEGELLVSCNIVVARPQRTDGILYGIDGGIYPHDAALHEFPRTGDLLKPVGDLGWVAVSGLARFDGEAFGSGFDGNLFSALFNRHKVQRQKVTRDGAGFAIASEDFLTSDDADFHPTDVLQDADGSLLVIDTGGWFRIGCPVSQVAKPNELGGIYRIRRGDAQHIDDPRGLRLNWDDATPAELLDRLGDRRPAVVERAANALAKMDRASRELEAIASRGSGRAAITAVWILMRRDTPESRASVRSALANADPSVRRTAIRAAGLVRDRDASSMLIRALDSNDPAESREAALALARIDNANATGSLLSRLGRATDPFHVHALTLALLHTGDRDGVARGLSDRSATVRRAALIALDQMPGGELSFEQVAPLLAAGEPTVRAEATAIVTKRPRWAAHAAEQIRAALSSPQPDPSSLRALIVAFAASADVQRAVADALHEGKSVAALLEAIAAAPLTELPADWSAAIGDALLATDDDVARAAIDAVRTRAITTFDDRLLRLARDPKRADALRVAALTAAAARITPAPDDFAFLLAQLDASRSPALARLAAARCIASLNLTDAQLVDLATTALPSAGPMEAGQLLAAFERSSSRPVGAALIASLHRSSALKSISATSLRNALRNFPPDVVASADPILKQLDAGDADRAQRLAELEAQLGTSGDPSRGQTVFLGKTASCTTCHAIAGAGGQVGPDLSKIGALRSRRDLLESIVFPSASIARGFEPFVVETTDGNVYAGTLAAESADAIHLKTPAEVTIPRAQVKSFRPDRVSIMPQGLDAQLSNQELADLLAFLAACK